MLNIPDVVWSGVLASLITLTGVALANWNSRRQLGQQLVHATNEKNRERQMQLRREVLLDAVTWASATLVSIGNLLLFGTEMKEAEALRALGSTPSRVPVIGGAETNRYFSAILLLYTQ